ncbi:hypothetical protein MHBO_002118 [Bonamia ostreae]|uniref:Transmembrane protein n=1 Tax=Bonamia ostreae TaxID=126728 RepID=A0ABV2AM38_9EUKA
METKDLLPKTTRFMLLLPAIIFCFLLLLCSILSAFFAFFTRLHYLLILAPFFILFFGMLSIPSQIVSIFKMIPFLKIKVTYGNGYYCGQVVLMLMLTTIVCTLVDHFMPPVYPMPLDDRFSEVAAEMYEKEIRNPIKSDF